MPFRRQLMILMMALLILILPTPVMALEQQVDTITGFSENTMIRREVSYHHRPTEESVKATFPTSIGVYLNGEKTLTMIPVLDWECIEIDYATTEDHYVQFSPILDNDRYRLAAGLTMWVDGPFVGLFLKEDWNLASGMVRSASAAALSTSASVTGLATEREVFTYFTDVLHYNSAVACGIMANIYAESTFIPNNLQDYGNSKLGLTDAEYTSQVDLGTYANFAGDSFGYGYCQWTSSDRKAALLAYAKSKEKSVGDGLMQLEFLMKELSGAEYVKLRSYINGAANTNNGAYDIGYYYCSLFERPASKTAPITRGNLARRTFWPIYGNGTTLPEPEASSPTTNKTYTITYSAGGGSGTMANTTVTYGVSTALRRNTFTRSGYQFAGWKAYRQSDQKYYTTSGWKTQAEIDKYKYPIYVYQDMQKVAKTSSVNKDMVTMTALWKSNTFTIKYSANGGSGTMSNTTVTYGVSTKLAANRFTKSGYTFNGWKAYRASDQKYYTTAGWKSAADISKYGYSVKLYPDLASVAKTSPVNLDTITMTAQWKRIPTTFTITFQPNGGSGTMPSLTVEYGVSTPLPANRFTCPGYQFVGWTCCRKSDWKWYTNEAGWQTDAAIAANKYTKYVYSDRQKVAKTSAVNGDSVVMYAKWR